MFSGNTRIYKRDDVVCKPFEGEYGNFDKVGEIVYSETSGKILIVDETAAVVWRALDVDGIEAQLVIDHYVKRFSAIEPDAEKLENDAKQVLGAFFKAGIVEGK